MVHISVQPFPCWKRLDTARAPSGTRWHHREAIWPILASSLYHIGKGWTQKSLHQVPDGTTGRQYGAHWRPAISMFETIGHSKGYIWYQIAPQGGNMAHVGIQPFPYWKRLDTERASSGTRWHHREAIWPMLAPSPFHIRKGWTQHGLHQVPDGTTGRQYGPH